MGEIRKILLFLLGSVLLGAALAPWLYWGGRALAGHGVLPVLGELAFPKYFDRAILLAALGLIWPTLRSLKIGSLDGLGLHPNPHAGRDLLAGFVSAYLCMALFGAVLLIAGAFRWRPKPDWWGWLGLVFSAGGVALLEEWLFRGIILGLFRRALIELPAVLASAALFSILHFLKPPAGGIEPVDWLTGFRILPTCFAKFGEPVLLAAGFSTLFLVGCVLGWSVLRTRSLWLGIGMHAGWVLAKGGFGKAARRALPGGLPWYGDDLIVGLGALAVVALTWMLCALFLSYADRRRRAPRW